MWNKIKTKSIERMVTSRPLTTAQLGYLQSSWGLRAVWWRSVDTGWCEGGQSHHSHTHRRGACRAWQGHITLPHLISSGFVYRRHDIMSCLPYHTHSSVSWQSSSAYLFLRYTNVYIYNSCLQRIILPKFIHPLHLNILLKTMIVKRLCMFFFNNIGWSIMIKQ